MHNQVTWAGILFFNDTATTEIYTLSLHDALPISSEAPVYSVRDPDGVRQQVRWQELLTLAGRDIQGGNLDRKSTRLNSSHSQISYAVFCLKKKKGGVTAWLRILTTGDPPIGLTVV